jgi:hypothetical protein
MAVFKEFSGEDIRTNKSFLNQLVDIINTDVSSSATRRKYQVFVTGGVGPGVTSSLFQTVFDQEFSLQTANAVFDLTVGIHSGSRVVLLADPQTDTNGKQLFPTETMMLREKIDIYRLMAQNLLGDAGSIFTVQNADNTTSEIKEALFFCFKRLFSRDQIKRETFALKISPSASVISTDIPNISRLVSTPPKIYTDLNSSTNKAFLFGGQVSTVVDSSNTSVPVGLLFNERGVLVLDASRSLDQTVEITGSIDAVTAAGTTDFSGSMTFFLMSASIDDIVDHIASTRFSGSDDSSITFQNITNINSSLYFIRLAADEFNYSSNPTYIDSSGRIVVVDEGQEDEQTSFTFITTVGLYDAFDNLLAVAKLSRPVLKNSARDLTLRVRLDY